MKLSETFIFLFMIRAIAGIRSAITSPYPPPVDAVQNIPLFINLSTGVSPPEDSAVLSLARENEHDTRGKKQFSPFPTHTPMRFRFLFSRARSTISNEKTKGLWTG